jgi:hypothetical protein
MGKLMLASASVGMLFISMAISKASDPRCDAPPYGMTDTEFTAFSESFGQLVAPTKILPALCNAKYGGADRAALHNLGFTDQDIDSKSMGDLAPELMIALKNLADKTPTPGVIYALFLCTYVTTMPQLNHCELPGAGVGAPNFTTFDDKEQCEAAAAQNNAAFGPLRAGSNVYARYVCMEKPTWQPTQ